MKTFPLKFFWKVPNLVLHESDEGGYDQRDAGGTGFGIEVGWDLVAEGFARGRWLNNQC